MSQLKSSTVYGDLTVTGSATVKENINVTNNAIIYGKLGIGTTSPTDLLEVSASSNASIRIASTSTTLSAGTSLGNLVFYGNDATAPGAGIKARISALAEATDADDAALIFATSDGTTNNVERVRINALGYVGIGTTTPSSKLTINANDTDGLIIRSADTNYSDLRLGVSTTGGYTYIQSLKSGTGTVRPLTLWADTTKVLEISSSTVTSNKPLALNAQNLTFDESSVRSWQMGVSYSTGNLTLQSGDYAGAFRLNTGLIFVDGKSASSTTFTSGSLGTGWKLDYNNSVSSKSYLEVDNILVRDTLRTHIFQKDVIKATNGQVYVSDSGIVADDYVGSNTIYLDVDKSATFSPGQILVCRDINLSTGLAISSVTMTVDSLGTEANGKQPYVVKDVVGTLSTIQKGMTIVRVSGGALLLDASTFNSPFMDVLYDRVPKTRIGNLAGVTSPTMGTLTGYGIWSDNAYLEKNANIVGTLSVGGGSTIGNTFYVGKISTNYLTNSDLWVTGLAKEAIWTSVTNSTDVIAPDGNNTTTKAVVGTTGNPYLYELKNSFASALTAYTLSVWIRTNTGTGSVDLRIEDRTNSINAVTICSADTTWRRFTVSIVTGATTPTNFLIGFLKRDTSKTFYMWGAQLELGSNVTPYQKTDTTLSSSTGYGMWSTAGGFGGTIQSPVVTLNDYGLKILGVGTQTSLTANTIMIGNVIANGTPANMASSIRLANTGTNSTSGLYGYNSSGTEQFALRLDGSAQIAGWVLDSNKLLSSAIVDDTTPRIILGTSVVQPSNLYTLGQNIGLNIWKRYNDQIYYNLAIGKGLITTGTNWVTPTQLGASAVRDSNRVGIQFINWNGFTLNDQVMFEVSQDTTVTGGASSTGWKGVLAGWKFNSSTIYSSNQSGTADGSAYTTAGMVIGSGGFIATPNFRVSTTGNLYAQNADIAGKITASSGDIAGWAISSTNIQKAINTNRTITLSSSRGSYTDPEGLSIYRTDADIAVGDIKIVTLGQIRDINTYNGFTGTDYGLEIIKYTASSTYKHILRVGGQQAMLAGWNFDTTHLYNSGSSSSYTGLSASTTGTEKAFFTGATANDGTNAKAYINVDGSGALANGNITWDNAGAVTINGTITAGIGSAIPSLPQDVPTLYYSFDEVPEIPDDLLNTTYLSNWATDTTWSIPGTGTLVKGTTAVYTHTSGSGYISAGQPSAWLSKKMFIRARIVSADAGTNLIIGGETGSGSTSFTKAAPLGQWITLSASIVSSYTSNVILWVEVYNSTHNYVLEVETIYVGTGQYTTKSIDNSGNTNYGVINGPIPTEGISGKALYCTAGNSLAPVTPIVLSGDWTISCWLKFGYRDSNGYILFGKAASGSGYALYFNSMTASTFQWTIQFDGETGGGLLASNIPIEATNYHHFCITKSGGTVTAYRDGIKLGDKAVTSSHVLTVYEFIKGYSSAYWYNGSIDETVILYRAVTAQEVWALYQYKTYHKRTVESIAGWTTSGQKILSNNISGITDGTAYTTTGMVLGNSGYISSPNFRVSTGGNLYAQSADISGKITASSGAIGGWGIDATSISTSSASNTIRAVSTAYNSVDTGFYLGGTGVFRVGTVTSGPILSKGIWFDGTNLAISTPNFSIASNGTVTIGAGVVQQASIKSKRHMIV